MTSHMIRLSIWVGECLTNSNLTLKNGEQEMEKVVFEHLLNANGFRSILKGIPFSEENLRDVKYYIRKFFKNQKVTIRTRWRGTRNHHQSHNIKSEAERFDIYVYA